MKICKDASFTTKYINTNKEFKYFIEDILDIISVIIKLDNYANAAE